MSKGNSIRFVKTVASVQSILAMQYVFRISIVANHVVFAKCSFCVRSLFFVSIVQWARTIAFGHENCCCAVAAACNECNLLKSAKNPIDDI